MEVAWPGQGGPSCSAIVRAGVAVTRPTPWRCRWLVDAARPRRDLPQGPDERRLVRYSGEPLYFGTWLRGERTDGEVEYWVSRDRVWVQWEGGRRKKDVAFKERVDEKRWQKWVKWLGNRLEEEMDVDGADRCWRRGSARRDLRQGPGE